MALGKPFNFPKSKDKMQTPRRLPEPEKRIYRKLPAALSVPLAQGDGHTGTRFYEVGCCTKESFRDNPRKQIHKADLGPAPVSNHWGHTLYCLWGGPAYRHRCLRRVHTFPSQICIEIASSSVERVSFSPSTRKSGILGERDMFRLGATPGSACKRCPAVPKTKARATT